MKAKSLEQTIDKLRKSLDAEDRKILAALKKRFNIAQRIGAVKEKINAPVLQESRWAEVLKDRLKRAKVLGISESFVAKVYSLVHEESLRLQKKVRKKK